MDRQRIWIEEKKLLGRTRIFGMVRESILEENGEVTTTSVTFSILPSNWRSRDIEAMKTTIFISCAIEKAQLFKNPATLRISVGRTYSMAQTCCLQIERYGHFIPCIFKALSRRATMETESNGLPSDLKTRRDSGLPDHISDR
jgi:hypothetical protein